MDISEFFLEMEKAVEDQQNQYKSLLFSDELKKPTPVDTDEYVQYLHTVISLYRKFCFTRDAIIIERFRELGVKEEDLIWFTDIKEITAELRRIEKNGVVNGDYPKIISLILLYLNVKILSLVYKNEEVLKMYGASINPMEAEMKRFMKRKSSKTGTPGRQNSALDIAFNKLLDEPVDSLNTKQLLLKSSKADIEDYFFAGFYPHMVQKKDANTSDGEVYEELYNFFRLVTKDPQLIPLDQFSKLHYGYRTRHRFAVTHIKRLINPRNSNF